MTTCSVQGCEQQAGSKHADFKCVKHYAEWLAERIAAKKLERKWRKKVCSVEGCGNKHKAKTLCRKHYNRQREAATN